MVFANGMTTVVKLDNRGIASRDITTTSTGYSIQKQVQAPYRIRAWALTAFVMP